jgi:uncharacterized protein YprB with RNaseH-like and TPR domain
LLEHTFLHIPSIGPRTERMLWGKGIWTWKDFLLHPGPFFSEVKEGRVREELKRSLEKQEDPSFFAHRLPPNEHWRLYEPFRHRAVFLDIETSGGFPETEEITVIGLFDGRTVRTFINGRNLEAFEEALSAYSVMVTFNGSCFDLPFLKKEFRGITFPPVHIDLRFLLKRLGLGGGLKRVEERLGLVRDPLVRGLDGWDAVRLWREYCGGRAEALERLILYNTMDIVHLKPLMDWAAREMKERLLNR